MKTKRVYELEVGDTFMYYNVERRVFGITKDRVYHKPTKFDTFGGRDSFGIFSQMKVEITGKWVSKIKTKPKVYA